MAITINIYYSGTNGNARKFAEEMISSGIVVIKGTFSGLGSLIVALLIGEKIPSLQWILCVILLGFVAYGLSIHFYIMAQKNLGAAKTSAYYSVAPFLGVIFSLVILNERPSIQFYVALTIMIISTVIMVKDTITLQHTHEHEHIHTHEHSHGDIVHTHEHKHVHTHIHTHGIDSENHSHKHELTDHQHSHCV